MLHLLTSGACHFPVLITANPSYFIIQDRIVNIAYLTLPYWLTEQHNTCIGPSLLVKRRKTYKPASLNGCGGEGPAGTHFQEFHCQDVAGVSVTQYHSSTKKTEMVFIDQHDMWPNNILSFNFLSSMSLSTEMMQFYGKWKHSPWITACYAW